MESEKVSDGKSGRPGKNYRVVRNEASIKCFAHDAYVGSISEKELVFYVARLRNNESKLVKVQAEGNTKGEVEVQKSGEAQL